MNYAPVANGLFWLAGWAGARQKLILGSMTSWSLGWAGCWLESHKVPLHRIGPKSLKGATFVKEFEIKFRGPHFLDFMVCQKLILGSMTSWRWGGQLMNSGSQGMGVNK